MSKDLSPHIYRPLPTPKAHCRKCLGTERNDFCKAPLIIRDGWAPVPALPR